MDKKRSLYQINILYNYHHTEDWTIWIPVNSHFDNNTYEENNIWTKKTEKHASWLKEWMKQQQQQEQTM